MKKTSPRLILLGTLLFLVAVYILLLMVPEDLIAYAETIRTPLLILTVFAGVVFVFFVFVIILKKRISFVPNLSIVFGVFGYLLIALLAHGNSLPHRMVHTLEEAFLGIVCVAAAIALYKRTGKTPVWIPLAAIAMIGSLALFIGAFITGAPDIVQFPVEILCVIYFVGMLCAIFIAANSMNIAELMLIPLISCMLTASTVFGGHKIIQMFSPEFVIALLILLITIYSGCKEFIILEKSHNELTKNFEKELIRQTNDLRSLLDEREKLLRFLSHDMRKPVVSIRRFLIEVIAQEKDAEQIKALNIIDMKVKNIEKSLTELAGYSKMTYVAESSKVFSIMDVVRDVYETLKPDCDANGIHFSVYGENFGVFAKPNTLNSVLTNLVMNAVEHASCSSITLTVLKNGNEVSVIVTDDGVGIESGAEQTIFHAYESTSQGEAHGLGLYICRSHMESMNGRITCVQADGNLSFVVVVPATIG